MYPSRWVVIDDTDPRITYHNTSGTASTGTWSLIQTDAQVEIPTGPYFNNTLHSATAAGATLSFNFSGISVQVYVSTAADAELPLVGDAGICFVDGLDVGSSQFGPHDQGLNNAELCIPDLLEDREHTLMVKLPCQGLMFDRIEYAPSSNALLDNQLILVDDYDASINYGSGWYQYQEDYHVSQGNTTLDFSFIGVSLAWYWFYRTEAVFDTGSTATYTIDDGPSQVLDLISNPLLPVFGYRKLFETPTLPMGEHKLSISHFSDVNNFPLTLDYFLIQNGSSPSTISAAPPTPSPLPLKEATGETHHPPNFIGGLIGGMLAFILVLSLSILYYRRRPKLRDTKTEVHPFPFVTPIPILPTEKSPLSDIRVAVGAPILPCGCPGSPALVEVQQPDRPETQPCAIHACPPLPFSMTSKDSEGNTDERSSASPTVVVLADSGLRLSGRPMEGRVVELPPVYSPV